MSNSEFTPKPLTAKEALLMNSIIAGVVVFMAGLGTFLFHNHIDTVSPYAAAPVAAPAQAKKL